MDFDHLISIHNLLLAWRRITTGLNHHYKRYFRDIYYAYEIAIDQNLKDLRHRLKEGSYQPQPPTRVYLPKPSGLQRPLSLLSIEDQIVLQSIANLFALKLSDKRKPLQLKHVFSNIVESEGSSIFFFKDWHKTYKLFQKTIEDLYKSGFRWIAHFDLAAFYDTISHDLLLKIVYPRSQGNDLMEKVCTWLKCWSSERLSETLAHGIPQGPIASDFLSECFLLSIDKELSKSFKYIRYVDDIRLFGKTELDVRRAVVRLEILCRNKGLIPQVKKYTISDVGSLKAAVGMLPSLAPPDIDRESEKPDVLPTKQALRIFQSSLGRDGRRQIIKDKSRARYVLFRAGPSPVILNYVLRLLPRHPEHIEAFVYYLSNYKKSERVIRTCLEIIRTTPYEYVEGELWHILARMASPEQIRGLVDEAITTVKGRDASFIKRWGACHLLCIAEKHGFGNYSKFLLYQEALLQAILAPILPEARFAKGDVVEQMLKRSAFEPGLVLSEPLARRQLTPQNFGLDPLILPTQVQNVYRTLNIIQAGTTPVDPVGEIIASRYNVNKTTKWRLLFNAEYRQAAMLLSQADPVFDSGRSMWLSYQNSFNHALFLALQKLLSTKQLPGTIRIINRKSGELLTFGVMLDQNNKFSKCYPGIADAFRVTNKRRNTLPGSHPYTTKGKTRTSHLKKGEQSNLVKELSAAYSKIIQIIETNL